ncbi:hypothetical protein JM47_00645 [Ureaplasma diversum]|uniref:Uncharacterized protein n=1 Tax=Ureaplasma diversum TaxID=42094 RepID=A0A0C5RNW0_9BACT|nr:hypothetical protein [Ureaplasma diversum]AJQ45159.1 hypothetical protein JM47_00645 [Ureaplasma diversum]
MNKKLISYHTALILLFVMSAVSLCYFFIGSITTPSQVGFLANHTERFAPLSFAYQYYIDPNVFDYLNYQLVYEIVLSANGIGSIAVLGAWIISWIYYLIMVGMLKFWKGSMTNIIINSVIAICIVYLFIIIFAGLNASTIIENSYYSYLKSQVLANSALSTNQKVDLLLPYINHFNIINAEDKSLTLLYVSEHNIPLSNVRFNLSYSYDYVNFNKYGLIYWTITFASLVFIITFIYYLIICIQLSMIVNDNWKIKIKPRKKDLNIDRSKKNKKQEIVAPDPSLEVIFRELDL